MTIHSLGTDEFAWSAAPIIREAICDLSDCPVLEIEKFDHLSSESLLNASFTLRPKSRRI